MNTFALGHKIAESLGKSPDLASWGSPLTIKADIQLAAIQGNIIYIYIYIYIYVCVCVCV